MATVRATAPTRMPRPGRVIDLDAPLRPAEAPAGWGEISPEAAAELAAWRDRLTRDRLSTAPETGHTDRLRFRRRWWDGASYVPTAVVRRRGARFRVVESRGEVLTLPARRRAARRALRRIRQVATPPPELTTLASDTISLADRLPRRRLPVDDLPRGRPALRRQSLLTLPPRLVRIDQAGDGLRCPNRGCAALVPVPPPGEIPAPGRCPACGWPA